jgi:hypothetical protein
LNGFEDIGMVLNDSTIVVSQLAYVNGIRQIALLWLDYEGHVTKDRYYLSPYFDEENVEDTEWILPRDICMSTDGMIYLVAHIYFDSNHFCLMQIDPDGDLIWTEIVATFSTSDACNTIAPSSDGGVFVPHRDVVDGVINLFVHKYNSDGDEEWVVPINGYSEFHDFLYEDGTMIVSSFAPGSIDGYEGKVYKTDTTGQILWSIALGTDVHFQQWFHHIVKSSDGAYVAAGNNWEYEPENLELDGYYNWNGWLIKFEADGNLLWERKYHYLESNFDFHNIHDLIATQDGGYLFCGQAADLDTNDPDLILPNQQAWLVKVDEYGCLVPGCHVGIDEQSAHASYLKFGPNPVSQGEMLNVFAAGLADLKNPNISVFDINGKRIKSFEIEHFDSTYILTTQDMAIGAYTLTLEDSGVIIQSVKLIIK